MASFVSPQRAVLAVVVAMAAVVLFPTASAPAKKKSCARAGDALVAASSHVRVVRRRLARRDGMTRHAWAACWKATGRRSRLDVEEDGAEQVTKISVELVDGRYVGVVTRLYIGDGEIHDAAIYDAKTGRTLHTTSACGASATINDFYGVYNVVFLTGGGMAFACDRLLLFRRASSRTAEVIEPPGTSVGALAAFRGDVLFWRVETRDREVITKSLELF